MQLTDWTDLRAGTPCWQDPKGDILPSVPLPERAEIVVVGAGVMGASVAERLAAARHEVVVIDRRAPVQGATAASTALVLWASDVPLSQLSQTIGAEPAARMWRRVHRAVCDLAARVEALDLDCRWRSRPELYLAGNVLDGEGLAAEARARQAAGLPSELIAAAAVRERFGVPGAPALLSGDAFGVDPVALSLELLRAAMDAGARICRGEDVTGLEQDADGAVLRCASGARIAARRVVLATGYEAARWYLPEAFALQSSYAIASAPDTAPAWREHAMLWQASDPYLYARGTADGRIIVGGEDEETSDPNVRDALLGAKRGMLEAKAARFLGLDDFTADCAWTATFGTSPDGMPAIGRAANAEAVWLAYGFGGNGISFASLAASLLAAEFAGAPDPDAGLFDPYRFAGLYPSATSA